MLPDLSVVLSLLCLLLGSVLFRQAHRLQNPRNLLDRPSAAWSTARERQQRRTTRQVLRALALVAMLAGLGLLGLEAVLLAGQ
ncbi:hypothetical protein [Deinococcus ficus]|uniref:Uncharacterized protein n=1 Tax=Deinococcus ficus TaxID=317577 RepID=A0A221T0W7_9DEIO|nr:hypothetical protein [Deinococcus ficus]ASN82516.1 hypothetical protein DFI_15150 [Deinococcus ficus]